MVRASCVIMQCTVWWRSVIVALAARRREKEKLAVLVFVIFCLSRSGSLNLNKGLAHQKFSHSNIDIVAICKSILMQISAFFRGGNVLQTFEKTLELCCKVVQHLS